MDPAADLAGMLGDWDRATIKGATYQGVFNHEVYGLEGGVERVPTFTMRTADVDAANVVRDTRVTIKTDAWVVRDLQKNDDGAVTTLVLAPVMS